MVRNTNWKTWVILGVAVAVLVTSGGLVMASNMGFKINKQIYASYVSSAAPKRVNWVSLPYSNPYPNAKTLCTTLGGTASAITIFQLNPSTGAGSPNCICSICATTNLLDATKGVRITNTAATPANVILVGSSNESQALPTILGSYSSGAAPKKENWISVPYHTTWVKAEDICVSLGIGAGAGSIVRINGDPAATTTTSHPCGNTTISNFSIVIGEALDVRKTSAGDITGKLPPHF